MEFKYPKKFSPEQMGYVVPASVGGRVIILNNFAWEELGFFNGVSKIGDVSDVFCPFCQKGYIRITKIEPIYSAGPGRFDPRCYVGDNYELNCSAECGAVFFRHEEELEIHY